MMDQRGVHFGGFRLGSGHSSGKTGGVMLALFTGTHINKVDKKGRVSVPAPFRATLSGQGFTGAVVFPSFTSDCLEGCGASFLEELAAGMDATAAVFSEEEDDLATLIFAQARQIAFDTEGRIILPDDFMEHAGITDSAAFVGKGRKFQIWQPETLKAKTLELMKKAREKRPTIALARTRNTGGDA